MPFTRFNATMPDELHAQLVTYCKNRSEVEGHHVNLGVPIAEALEMFFLSPEADPKPVRAGAPPAKRTVRQMRKKAARALTTTKAKASAA